MRADGVDPDDEAALAAQRAFGTAALAADRSRDVWLPCWLQGFMRDLRFAVRLFAKERAFAATAILTLGLSLGVNATLFSIIQGMGNAAPVADPDRVVEAASLDAAGRPAGFSYDDFVEWRSHGRSFVDAAAYLGVPVVLTDRDLAADRLAGAYVSADTFHLVAERPVLGRDFRADEDRPGTPPVAIIAASVWNTRYGGDPAIVGRTIGVNGVPTVVVGVMRAGFRFPLVHDVWLPLGQLPGAAAGGRDERTLKVIARLAPGSGIEQFRAELTIIGATIAKAHPATSANLRFTARPFREGFDVANPWDIMFGAVTIVLLIACANVASLLLARAGHRAPEIALRLALGATRWRIVRQLAVESLLLSVVSGVVGLSITVVGVRVWVASMPAANWPYWYHFAIDRRIVAYIAAMTLGCGFVFGLAPGVHLAASNNAAQLKDAGRGVTAPARAHRWSSALLVAELALTLSLLAGAGLMGRTLAAMYRADAVVDTSHVAIASLSLSAQKYAAADARLAFYRQVEDRLAGVRALQAATLAGALPFYDAPIRGIDFRGRPIAPSQPAHASYVTVGTGYFNALGLRLLEGRTFTAVDGTAGHDAAIVNQRFASLYLAGSDPVGMQIRLVDPTRPDATPAWTTIVGVSPTVRQHYAQEIDPVVYVPLASNPPPGMSLIVRTAGDPAGTAALLRDEVRKIDPDLPLFNISTLDGFLRGTRFANQVFATMFGVFAFTALLLAAVGLHAVVAYAVVERTKEIGVRMALGARPLQVVWLFIRRLRNPLLAGLAAGLAGSVAIGRFVAGMLIQTSPNDPATLVTISVLLCVVAIVAAAHPAGRAARLDPLLALRHE